VYWKEKTLLDGKTLEIWPAPRQERAHEPKKTCHITIIKLAHSAAHTAGHPIRHAIRKRLTMEEKPEETSAKILSMAEHPAFRGRRRMLQLAGASAIGIAGAPASIAALLTTTRKASAETSNDPPNVGFKFARDGHVLPLPGNTIICHLPQQGEGAACFNALLDIYRQAPAHDFMRKVTLLPPSSYHMTVFGAATGDDRCAGLWPEDLAPDAPAEACNQLITAKLQNFKLNCALPLRMRVNLEPVPNDHHPLRIRLLPLDAAENKKLRDLRDRLSDTLGIRSEKHDDYEFHITLGYLIRWLSKEENETFRNELRRWREMVATRCPVIALGPPEFCAFEDMFAFQRRFFLS